HIPDLPGWQWLHTPGHTPGHVSLWRESDRCLIAGDAFITTRQESAYAVLTQAPELHGPPAYFTPDWDSAEQSVKKLAALQPDLVITGHGRAMQGAEMQAALQNLAENFRDVAVPEQGRYVLPSFKGPQPP
ncbi:MAG: fold metallo-hydrolase, partial [Verrucomicrobiaceae bacterium]|nr:fold metallo-hydrolase [Verrucomicrobiaceae bacterium]